MFTDVDSWWFFLSIISVINIILLFSSFVVFYLHKQRIHQKIYKQRQWLLWCSAVYTLVCAFRAFMPRIDLERICLVDSGLSTVFIGRSVTTVAEILFMVQCAILLNEAARGLGNRFSVTVSQLLVPLIVIAEICSWYAMLTTNYLGSVIEESIWTLCAILLVSCFIFLRSSVSRHHRKYLTSMILFGAGFIVFMITVDVPMYWVRWQEDSAAGIQYFTAMPGLVDSIQRCNINTDITVWRDEIPWMTLYFSVAVWASISMPHAPYYKTYRKRKKKKSAFKKKG